MAASGLALLGVGAALVLIEAHVAGLGVLGIPGVIALGAGGVLAVGGLGGGLATGIVVAVVLVGTGLSALALTFRRGIAVRRRRIRSGPERLIGQLGVVRRWDEPRGKGLVDGALWDVPRSWAVEGHDQDELHPA